MKRFIEKLLIYFAELGGIATYIDGLEANNRSLIAALETAANQLEMAGILLKEKGSYVEMDGSVQYYRDCAKRASNRMGHK